MRLTRILLALMFCSTLFVSCTVDELEDDTKLDKTEDVLANGEGDNPPDDDKGNGGG